ncbi:RING/U-box [Tricholoma matsutake]|nr:RING/U-box [Tricholoma matsutake 945]
MKVNVKYWHAVAHWRWDTGSTEQDDTDNEGDVCGICRVPYEGCCPSCKMPGDDCPLIWGECTHVFHMHCLLKWIGTAASKQQCPMDRRTWGMSSILSQWNQLIMSLKSPQREKLEVPLHRLWPHSTLAGFYPLLKFDCIVRNVIHRFVCSPCSFLLLPHTASSFVFALPFRCGHCRV